MILRTGINSQAFTLIEVLVAVVILSVGILGVIRAYITLVNGVEASRFTVEASYLLKAKMADMEKEGIENMGTPAGKNNGVFTGDFALFRWETEASPAVAENVKAKTLLHETLSQVRVSVIAGGASSKSLGLYTYLENYSE